MNSNFASALEAARHAAAGQDHPGGTLFVVATPIGNLADISLRALHVLQLADLIACEDTRHTQTLLHTYGMQRPAAGLMAVHQHNEQEAAQRVVQRLQDGQRVAFVSDAGTPGVSDPGARLVAAVRQAGLRVMPLPGASSLTTLLSVAGLPDGGPAGVVFGGFVPQRGAEREIFITSLASESRAVLLLESPHRIESLAVALAALGDRPLTVGRELTKQFEEVQVVSAQDFAHWLDGPPSRARGEFVLVLHPRALESNDGETDRVLGVLLEALPLKSAVQLAAAITRQPRNTLYQKALEKKSSAHGLADRATSTQTGQPEPD